MAKRSAFRLTLAATLMLAALGQGLAANALPCTIPAGLMLSEGDVTRLSNLVASRTMGLAAALASTVTADRRVVGTLYAEGLAPVGNLPIGNYRCRTIKLGGITDLTVYGYFECVVARAEGGLTITKTTGSQRFFGTLTPAGDGLAYRGALNYSDEGPFTYGRDAERDQVGCLYRVSDRGNAFVLEMPSPKFESFHDVIELIPR